MSWRIPGVDRPGQSTVHLVLRIGGEPPRHQIDAVFVQRIHLGVEKWTVFGGSWGSTLALAYAITVAHPGLAFNDVAVYITKGTSLEVKGLIPNDPNYAATLWAYNGSGFSNTYPLYFKTKK